MGHVAELTFDRGVEHRVAVAMQSGPPRGHAVDHLTSIGQVQSDALRRHHRNGRMDGRHGRIGMPDRGQVAPYQVGAPVGTVAPYQVGAPVGTVAPGQIRGRWVRSAGH